MGEDVERSVPVHVEGSDLPYMQDQMRELREQSRKSSAERIQRSVSIGRLNLSLYSHLGVAGWPDEVAVRVRLSRVEDSYQPCAPSWLMGRVYELEWESEHKGAIHQWVNLHERELGELAEDLQAASQQSLEMAL